MAKPVPGGVYTWQEVCRDLDLSDSPSLLVRFEGNTHDYWVQLSHLTTEQMLGLPDWHKVFWEYMYTTSEWVPIFFCRDPEKIKKLTDRFTCQWAHPYSCDCEMSLYPKGTYQPHGGATRIE